MKRVVATAPAAQAAAKAVQATPRVDRNPRRVMTDGVAACADAGFPGAAATGGAGLVAAAAGAA